MTDWNSKEEVMTVVKKRTDRLQRASEELRADREVVLAAVNNFGDALEYALDTSVEYFVTKALDRIHSGEVNIEGEG